jgi:esterase
MKLAYRKYGSGQPLIILHGLFGQSDNWNTHAKLFAEQNFEAYTVDMRNHGLSPHSDNFSYQLMSDDVVELITDNNLNNVILLGHSMGGKVAMQFAIAHPQLLNKLIVADMAPKYYPPHHTKIIAGLKSVDFKNIKSRREVESVLADYISDMGTKQFLLKNLYWKTDTELAWRFNLKSIAESIENMGEVTIANSSCETPALFIRGEKSKYILDEDIILIKQLFTNSTFETIAGAGHWLHADKPKEFFECVMRFIKSIV